MQKIYSVSGMSCASCAATIEKAITEMPFVEKAQVNFATEKLSVTLKTESDHFTEMAKRVESLGYLIHEGSEAKENSNETQKLALLELAYSFTVSILVFILAMTPWGMKQDHFTSGLIQFVLMTPVFFWVGRKFLLSLWPFFRRGVSSMNTLIGFGILAAYLYSVLVFTLGPEKSKALGFDYTLYFESIGFIVSFVILGKFLEEKVKKKARQRLTDLFSQGVREALVKVGDKFETKPAQEVVMGDVLLLKPGSKASVDGELLTGSSTFDESMLTGEGLPVLKKVGDKIFAGTINVEGVVTYRATHVGSETYLASLMKFVDEAQANRPEIGKIADKISSVFVPIVLIIAVLVFTLWMMIPANPSWGVAIAHMSAVLVIACPCALGLATPIAIVVALSESLGHGLLVRSAEVLEEGAHIKAIVMDKTGTLTVGKPQVSETLIVNESEREKILGSIAGVELYSEHPLSKALVQYVEEQGIKALDVDEMETIIGFGLKAVVGSDEWLIGSRALMEKNDIEFDAHEEWIESRSGTLVFAARKEKLVALFELDDEIRESTRPFLKELKQGGVEVILASGDRTAVVAQVAQELGVDISFGEQTPLDKAHLITELKSKYSHVSMVGDGMNDAAALASSDLSFAMGSGTEIAMEAADVTIAKNDLSKIVFFFKLSHKTYRVIRENLFFSFIYNVVGIPLAAGALSPWGINITPAFAALAMGLSSVSVVLNSLRIKGLK